MHRLFRYIQKCFTNIYRKVKATLSNKQVQKVLLVVWCSVGVSLYIFNRYGSDWIIFKRSVANIHPPSKPIVADKPQNAQIVLASWTSPLDAVTNWLFGDGTHSWGYPWDHNYPHPNPLMPGTEKCYEIMKYGFPGLDNVKLGLDYVMSYNNNKRIANWVYEHLTADKVKHGGQLDITKCAAKDDSYVHPYFRTTISDFYKSGYYRRQLAHPSHHHSQYRHLEETYHMSNMVPQIGIGCWSRLERHVKGLTETYPNIYCCTGTLFLPKLEADGKKYVKYQLIGKNQMAVPTHYFKVVIAETPDDDLEMECYVMENSAANAKGTLEELQVQPEFIEKAAGLLFLGCIHKERLKKINGKSIRPYEPTQEDSQYIEDPNRKEPPSGYTQAENDPPPERYQLPPPKIPEPYFEPETHPSPEAPLHNPASEVPQHNSGPETPQHPSNSEMPQHNPASERPPHNHASETTQRKPASEVPQHYPASNTPEHHSTFEAPQHNPPSETLEHNSASETTRHNSTPATPQHKPPSETPQHNSASEIPQHNLAPEVPQHNPASETSQHNPASEIPQQYPASETPQHNPASEIPQHYPPSETPQHTPASEMPQHNPATETPQHNPAFEIPQHNPPSETPQHTPASEIPQHNPVTEIPQHNPAYETPQHHPGSETKGQHSGSEKAEPVYLLAKILKDLNNNFKFENVVLQ